MFFEIRKFQIFRKVDVFLDQKWWFFKKTLDILVWSSFSLAFAQNLKMDKPKEKKHIHLNAEEKRHVAQLIANGSTCLWVFKVHLSAHSALWVLRVHFKCSWCSEYTLSAHSALLVLIVHFCAYSALSALLVHLFNFGLRSDNSIQIGSWKKQIYICTSSCRWWPLGWI